jgi:hypothetical protein
METNPPSIDPQPRATKLRPIKVLDVPFLPASTSASKDNENRVDDNVAEEKKGRKTLRQVLTEKEVVVTRQSLLVSPFWVSSIAKRGHIKNS